MQFMPSAGRVASMSARAVTASFFSLRSRTMALESRQRPGPTSLRCPSSQPRAVQAPDSAWLSATGSSSNGTTEKSTSARVRMAHNLMCGCRLNRPRTLRERFAISWRNMKDSPPTRLRLGMVGGGRGAFIGEAHRIAARLDDRYELVAGALSADPQRAIESGRDLRLDPIRCYTDYRGMAQAEATRKDGAEVVSVVTPNASH